MALPTRAQLDQQYDRYGQPLIEAPWSPEEIMNNDVDGDGKTIRDLGGMSVGFKTTKEICLGARTSGKPGSGSWDDPFDISSQALFDAKMTALVALANTKVILRFRDGQFDLTGPGAVAANVLRDWEIYGEGPGKTIIRQMAAGFVFSVGQATNRRGVTIEGITFDCGYFRIGTTGNWSPLVIGGANCRVRNCEVYGAGNDDDECFVIWIGSGASFGSPPDNALVEDCYAHDCGENASMIAVTNLSAVGGSPVYGKGGIIRGNRLIGDAANYASQGIGLAGFDGGIIAGNYIYDATHGIYEDTYLNKNLIIQGNQIHAVDNGILYNVPTQAQESIYITGNVIRSNSCIGLQSSGGHITKLRISDNVMSDLTGGSGNFSINLVGVNGAVILDNTIDYPALSHSFTNCTDIYSRGNRTPEGLLAIPEASLYARVDASSGGGGQTIANVTRAVVDFYQATFNDSSVFDLTTDLMTAPTIGTVKINTGITFSSITSAGSVQLEITKNGTQIASLLVPAPVADKTYALPSIVDRSAADDEYAVTVYNATGATLTISRNFLYTFANFQFEPS